MKRVFPVIHLTSPKNLADALYVSQDAGAAGVFLIDMGNSSVPTDEAIVLARAWEPDLWLGANFLGRSFKNAVEWAAVYQLDGVWVDNAGVTPQAVEDGVFWTQKGGAVQTFGGTAFKTQRAVPREQLRAVAGAAANVMDVVTGSGRGTGVSADIEYLQEMRVGVDRVPGTRLAVASGVSPENAADQLRYADDVLLATGIESEFGVFDPDRLRKVVAIAVQAG